MADTGKAAASGGVGASERVGFSSLFNFRVPADSFKYPDAVVQKQLEEMQKVYGLSGNIEEELKLVEAVEPPQIVKEMMRVEGKLGVDFSDPEVQKILAKASQR
eukprot:TRINITY_DN7879_c0_g2_i1.p2 TRINITY_DN7879_c0_g2~~TRINITY_DN7879_c0_g2_i1.p2  ORF type:complete len:116 (+),score=29.59 TRINITY_DN7879_c0_g2_i1:38-349(+)